MRLSELLEGYDINGSRAFWYNTFSKELIEIEIEHFYYVLNNLSIFELTIDNLTQCGIPFNVLKEFYSKKLNKLPTLMQSPYKKNLFNMIFKKGWVRVVLQYETQKLQKHLSLYIETDDLSKVQQTANLFKKESYYNSLSVEIINDGKYIKDFRLYSQEDINYFINTGKVPEKIMTENISELPNYIDYKGKQVSTRNSLGNYIGNSIEAIQNFYNWFGNSKIVDEQNRPLVVYHGTNIDFEEFDINKSHTYGNIGSGIYFTLDKNEAKKYGNIIKSCYLNCKNVLNTDDEIYKNLYTKKVNQLYNYKYFDMSYEQLLNIFISNHNMTKELAQKTINQLSNEHKKPEDLLLKLYLSQSDAKNAIKDELMGYDCIKKDNIIVVFKNINIKII